MKKRKAHRRDKGLESMRCWDEQPGGLEKLRREIKAKKVKLIQLPDGSALIVDYKLDQEGEEILRRAYSPGKQKAPMKKKHNVNELVCVHIFEKRAKGELTWALLGNPPKALAALLCSKCCDYFDKKGKASSERLNAVCMCCLGKLVKGQGLVMPRKHEFTRRLLHEPQQQGSARARPKEAGLAGSLRPFGVGPRKTQAV